ncbi:hypothetical protein ACFVUB_34615 [Streptomyces niveus]|uniref:hypothetical protein n=1 Tax=Streptomyces niveus TaxID=193462 RepID=UPI0036DAFDA2
MSAEQHNEAAYGKELAAISRHQSEATNARFTVFQAFGRRRDRTGTGGGDHSRALHHLILE